jgi:hypothetical protein
VTFERSDERFQLASHPEGDQIAAKQRRFDLP